ncbi:MAG: TRAP transporter small permease subunit [Chloroflexota bacterium]|nr:MAG: TRAP transporter small permease subunit [Chloroflexota bacterium]
MRKWTVKVSNVIVVISALIVIYAVCLQIILRYVFRQPLLGLEEIALLVVLWLWFFGMAAASEKGFHITGGLPVTRQSIQNVLKMVYPFICLIATLIFCYLTYLYCQWVVTADIRSIALQIPYIVSATGVFLGLVLNAAYLTSEAVAKLRAFQEARKRSS